MAQWVVHQFCADKALASGPVVDSQLKEGVVAWLSAGSWSSLDLEAYWFQGGPCVLSNLTEDRGGIRTSRVGEKNCGKPD